MSKFNRPTPLRQPDAFTAQGGEGFARDSRDELFLLGLANMVGEDTFYESGKARDARFAALIGKVTQDDPAWVRAYGRWLRTSGLMRSAPIVVACEYVEACGANGRALVDAVCQRPDEPAEVLAYWMATHGRRVPMAVKRGVADACTRLYTERSVLRYDGQDKAWRFGDVIEIAHPKPKAPWQSALFRHCIERRHNRDDISLEGLPTLAADKALLALPDEERRAALGQAIETGWSWERLGGWLPGGMDAQAWQAVIPNMGLMALVRNLRNFDDKGVSDSVADVVKAKLRDPEEVRASRQFPLRFLSAWKNTNSMRWAEPLEIALNHSLSNVPSLSGRTLIMIDVSGSMQDNALSRVRGRSDGVRPERWEVASLFGLALAARAEKAEVVLFREQPVAEVKVNPGDSVLRVAQACQQFVGGGTNTLGSLVDRYNGHDRVIILTDEQTGTSAWGEASTIRCPVFTFNLAGYERGHTPIQKNWFSIGGLSDACFVLIDTLERRRQGSWPWQEMG